MTKLTHRSSILAAFGVIGLLAGLTGCSDDGDSDKDSETSPSTSPEPGAPAAAAKGLVIVTERTGIDNSTLHYLHVLPDWPSGKQLDHGRAVELGSPGVARVEGGAVYFYHAEDGTIEKFNVDKELKVSRAETISFTNFGIMGFDAEPIWSTPEAAYLLDEKSGQLARWSPSKMQIDGVTKVDPAALMREMLKGYFQLGVSAAGRLYTNVNWRDWDKKLAYPAAALGVFDQNMPEGGPQIVEDTRCAPSVGVGVYRQADGYLYLVGDGANGFDLLASKNKSTKPQCVVRLREGETAFDPSFFVDLNAVTGSPGIRNAYPMAGGKLLVSMWSPEVDPATVADPTSDDWFWSGPNYEYAIVDLKTKTSTKVAGLPRGKIEGQKTLIVDDQNYVQTFRADRGTVLHRVGADGSVTEVLVNESATNVQYIGRL